MFSDFGDSYRIYRACYYDADSGDDGDEDEMMDLDFHNAAHR